MTSDELRIFNDKNLRSLINRKVEEENKSLKSELELIKRELFSIRENMRILNDTARFVRSLPAYKDLKGGL